jgi:hypothetical protein
VPETAAGEILPDLFDHVAVGREGVLPQGRDLKREAAREGRLLEPQVVGQVEQVLEGDHIGDVVGDQRLQDARVPVRSYAFQKSTAK